MRSIQISTEVFAKIWSQRIEGEENENDILARLLGIGSTAIHQKSKTVLKNKTVWRDDVRQALINLNGESSLKDIYEEVRKIRLSYGRSLPLNTEAIIRRELETNSSDTEAFTGNRDWFRSVNGIGGGRWAVRTENVE